jgi:hypothetical protein
MNKETKEELGLEFSGETKARMDFVSKNEKIFDISTKKTASSSSSAESISSKEKNSQEQDAIPTEMKIHVRTSGEQEDQEDYEDPVNIVTRPTTGVSSGLQSSEKTSRTQSAKVDELKEVDEEVEEEAFPEKPVKQDAGEQEDGKME